MRIACECHVEEFPGLYISDFAAFWRVAYVLSEALLVSTHGRGRADCVTRNLHGLARTWFPGLLLLRSTLLFLKNPHPSPFPMLLNPVPCPNRSWDIF